MDANDITESIVNNIDTSAVTNFITGNPITDFFYNLFTSLTPAEVAIIIALVTFYVFFLRKAEFIMTILKVGVILVIIAVFFGFINI